MTGSACSGEAFSAHECTSTAVAAIPSVLDSLTSTLTFNPFAMPGNIAIKMKVGIASPIARCLADRCNEQKIFSGVPEGPRFQRQNQNKIRLREQVVKVGKAMHRRGIGERKDR